MKIQNHIRTIADFPKPGILFYDISTLLINHEAFKLTIDKMTDLISEFKPTVLVALESKGFLIAPAIAYKLGIGLVMMRKKGKLPGLTNSCNYDLEYGTDTLEIQNDIIDKKARAVIVDDVLATAGTANAACSLINQLNINIAGIACVIELKELKGREKLSSEVPFKSLLQL